MMKRVVIILLLCCSACSDTGLEILPVLEDSYLDNKLSVSGQLCTQSPEDLVFPLRVVFLVDGSESMEVNDPPDPVTGETGRERAVRETVGQLFENGQDVKVSLVRFSSQAQPLTVETDDQGQLESYFTDDMDKILVALPTLAENDRTTNYIRAISEAYAEIRHEVMHASLESLALSTYHIVMITDGIPDAEGTGDDYQEVYDSIESIMELGRLFHLGNISFNTALISSGNLIVDAYAEELLQTMAEDYGQGTFRSFDSGGQLNFLFVDLSALRRVFTLKTLLAQNINALVIKDLVYADSDGDGLADDIELAIASNPFVPDSDGDGCRDGLEYKFKASGLDPIDPEDCLCFVPDYCFDEDQDGRCDCGTDEPDSCCQDNNDDGFCDCIDNNFDGLCDPENYTDSDGDGLYDCEERFSGTNRNGPDTDGDGLVDFTEVRFGTSPDINDIYDDFDWDAVPNGEEVKSATDPGYDSSQGRSQIAYRYRVETSEARFGSTCYDFSVENITITQPSDFNGAMRSVGPAGQGYSSWNRILIFAGEVPFDDLDSYARFRVGCVQASYRRDGNYKNPPSGQMQLEESDFVDLTEFDADVHCRYPGDNQ